MTTSSWKPQLVFLKANIADYMDVKFELFDTEIFVRKTMPE